MEEQQLKIRILPENLINKIAAGEVIDRPSSVVKELVENSIDAGADKITVIVRDGGKGLIQVIDNGAGMEEKDAIMSIQRHATSKISTYEDMEQIVTLGFRGEALASIAAVARLEMKTVTRDNIEGTQINIEGGTVVKMDKTGGNPGTSIAVKNLFYNTPARRKFLRATSTEYRHIMSTVNRFVLAYPHIAFDFFHDENQVFSYKPAELLQRIGDVLGERIRENLIFVDDTNALLKCYGYIGNFDILRKSRNDQYLFVNKRYIVDRTINAAITSGLGEILPARSFPLYILFLDINPDRIDVNVHPTKNEIKFADQQMLFSLIRGAVKRAVKTDEIVPEMQEKFKFTKKPFIKRFPSTLIDEIYGSETQQTRFDFDRDSGNLNFGNNEQPTVQSGSHFRIEQPQQADSEPQPRQETKMLWQFHNKYLLSQIKSGLVVIDQHAAHERIIYERVKKNFVNRESSSQQLLFPQTIDLSIEDYDYLMEILPFLEKIGFIIKGFGTRTIVVEGVPAGLRTGHENKLLLDILDEYKLKLGAEVDIQERVAKSVACRSAIMTGDPLTDTAMSALVDQLFACETPYFCPHGRPTMITLSLEELDKRFERL
ncbi:DNA mismatch repair endonuclease MutL [candidate division KSB1 bacterium]|nr:DNA mismatch repair endonuclease MutL [candidate division KSB1 bacterium]